MKLKYKIDNNIGTIIIKNYRPLHCGFKLKIVKEATNITNGICKINQNMKCENG